MIWLSKIIILLVVIGLTGCTPIENQKGENPAVGDIDVVVISKPDKMIISTPEAGDVMDSEPDTAYSYNSFSFDEIFSSVEPVSVTFSICSPLASVPFEELSSVVSDPYDPPPMGKDDRHQGTDFAYYRRFDRASIADDVVQSVFSGKIASIIDDKFPYGNAVIVETPFEILSPEIQQKIGIQDNQSLYTLYGHLASISVQKISNEVIACQPVGNVGKTGNTGVEHLHLEMRIGPSNQVIQSMGNFMPEITESEREAYTLWRTSGVFLHFDPMKILDNTP